MGTAGAGLALDIRTIGRSWLGKCTRGRHTGLLEDAVFRFGTCWRVDQSLVTRGASFAGPTLAPMTPRAPPYVRPEPIIGGRLFRGQGMDSGAAWMVILY